MPRIRTDLKARLSEARRAQILEAAGRVFARKGFDRATIKDIARAARLSEGSIYNYFRSKEDLLIQIPLHVVRPALEPRLETGEPPQTAVEVERQLLTLAKGIVGGIRENVWFLKVFVSALPRLSPSARERYVYVLPLYAMEKVERLLRNAMRAGLLRHTLDPVIAARAFLGMVIFFLMMQEVLLEKQFVPHTYEAIVEETVRLFVRGAAARHPPQTERSAVRPTPGAQLAQRARRRQT